MLIDPRRLESCKLFFEGGKGGELLLGIFVLTLGLENRSSVLGELLSKRCSSTGSIRGVGDESAEERCTPRWALGEFRDLVLAVNLGVREEIPRSKL